MKFSAYRLVLLLAALLCMAGCRPSTHYVTVEGSVLGTTFRIKARTTLPADERKHRLGKLAYIMEGIKELRHMHAIPLHVRTESGEFDFNALMALVFNGETAGGFRLANTSSVRDGIFDCLLLEKRNFLVSCFAMVRYLCGGHPRSVRHLRAATLQISSPIDEPTDVDGQRGARFPLDVRCLPGLLRVVCPRDGRR